MASIKDLLKRGGLYKVSNEERKVLKRYYHRGEDYLRDVMYSERF